MPPTPPPSLPPGSADCQTTLHLAQPPAPGAPATPPAPWKMVRAPDGQTRLDFANQSVISNPATGETTVLDHLKKEATVFPAPKPPVGAPPAIPGMPAMPSVPGAPPPTVQNLGKKFIDGHEAEGKLFTFQPPAVPAAPAQPAMPAIPKGLPIPQAKPPAPPVPAAPKVPQTVETWTSTQFHMPVLTTVSGSFGKQVSRCKCAPASPPPSPSVFQVPAGYKLFKKTQ
jgi:hypothetical protein